MPEKLRMRKVKMDDFWLLFAWRHDDVTEFFSFHPAPTVSVHSVWMQVALRDEARWLFYVDDPSVPVGMVHVEPAAQTIDIIVNPLCRNHGYGTQMVRQVQERFNSLRAKVVIGNSASFHVFKRCGFVSTNMQTHNNKPYLLMEWSSCNGSTIGP